MIKTVGVVGAGQMGGGIAQVCAASGYRTLVFDAVDGAAEKARGRIAQSLDRSVERGRLTAEDRDATVALLEPVASLDQLADADLVIEAAAEILDVKREIFRSLHGICRPEAILASNTSSLPIIEIATATGRRERVVGLHFFNPVPTMKVVEVVRSIAAEEAVVKEVTEFVRALGKYPVQAKDTPGFIVNFLLIPFLLDAIRAYENGVASKEDIDTGFVFGCNFPMGPLTLSDFIGLDVVYHIAESLYQELREPRYAPPVILKQHFLAGRLGQKTKRGFYDYATETPPSAR